MERKPRLTHLAPTLALIWLFSVPGVASAIVCPAAPPVCNLPAELGEPANDTWAPSSYAEARDCLCAHTQFFDGQRDKVLGGAPFASFDDILPPEYERTGFYSDQIVGRIVAFAAAEPRAELIDEILFDAAFRRASAHGLLGDDALLRGLDPSYPMGSGGGTEVTEAIRRLDSRVCHIVGAPVTTRPCASVGDCSDPGEDTCQATRFPHGAEQDGAYGAVQEYRRAEQALLAAIQVLGVERFREVDEAQGLCQGAGCGSRLLLRLAALKARAQAEHADALWRRAAAASGISSEAPSCLAGAVGDACSVHRDCDVGGVAGRCGGANRAEEAGVLLRGFVREALAEMSASEALYVRLLAGHAFEDSADWAMRRAAAQRLSSIELRSSNDVNPFGIPSDYVPILTELQRNSLNCAQESNADCLLNLALDGGVAGGSGILNKLAEAEEAATAAQANAQEFADRARIQGMHEDEMKAAYRTVIVRMLGDTNGGATCTQADQEAGDCVAFNGEVWLFEGASCEPGTEDCGYDDADAFDGELERHALTIRAVELAREQTLLRVEHNEERWEDVKRLYAGIAGIQAVDCEDSEAIIERSGAQYSAAIERREGKLEPTDGEFLYGFAKSSVGGILGLGERSLRGEDLGPVDLVKGYLGSVIGGAEFLFGFSGEERRRKARVEFEREQTRIRTETELATVRLRCRTNAAMLVLDEGEALNQLTRESQLLGAEFEQQALAMTDALAGAERLALELYEARDRLEEARELDAIWADAQFRNPANYRALALEHQLEGSAAFRTAQVITWMALRAVAYELGLPDHALLQRFPPGAVIGLTKCQAPRCSELPNSPCTSPTECQGRGEGVCEQTGSTQVSDGDGACSMQAVFAARTVADLRALLRSAAYELVGDPRTLACTNGCQKVISLRNIFTDVSAFTDLDPDKPALGEYLVDSPRSVGELISLEFAISLERELDLCPQLPVPLPPLPPPDPPRECRADGVANLSRSDEDGAGDLSINFWNARATNVSGTISYSSPKPYDLACRDPADGSVVNGSFGACLSGGLPVVEGTVCSHASPPSGQLGCRDPGTGADSVCQCLRLITVAGVTPDDPSVRLRQVDPGIVRTSSAGQIESPDTGPFDNDSLLQFRMRSGPLPIVGRTPNLRPFTVSSLDLATDLAVGEDDPNIRGVPVASRRWHLRLNENILKEGRYADEYLRSIDDIELTIKYQGFDL